MKTLKSNYATSEFQFCTFPDFWSVLSFSTFGEQNCNSLFCRRSLTKLTCCGVSFYPKVYQVFWTHCYSSAQMKMLFLPSTLTFYTMCRVGVIKSKEHTPGGRMRSTKPQDTQIAQVPGIFATWILMLWQMSSFTVQIHITGHF